MPAMVLLDVLRKPEKMAELPLKEWTWLVSLARVTHLLSRLSLQVTNLGLLDEIPEEVHPHLEAARVLAEAHDRELRWEVNRLERALRGIETPIVVVLRPPQDVESMERTAAFQEKCWQAGFPVFATIPRAANSIAKILRWARGRTS